MQNVSQKTRKELLAEYKERKVPMGVYQIRNTTNGKIFVGSSKDLIAIWNRNRLQLDVGNHPNTELQKDWKSLGEPGFAYEIVSELTPSVDDAPGKDYAEDIKELEKLFLEELQPYGEKGYNVKKG